MTAPFVWRRLIKIRKRIAFRFSSFQLAKTRSAIDKQSTQLGDECLMYEMKAHLMEHVSRNDFAGTRLSQEPDRGAKYCNRRVCMSVRMHVCLHAYLENRTLGFR